MRLLAFLFFCGAIGLAYVFLCAVFWSCMAMSSRKKAPEVES